MAMPFEMKKKTGKSWQHVSVAEVEGKTLRDLFLGWAGQEYVVKTTGGMICGSEKWVTYYRDRGEKVMTFEEAVAMLERKGMGGEVLVQAGLMQALGDVAELTVTQLVCECHQ
jgi:hypothetical protein